jgi:hypothetical protein
MAVAIDFLEDVWRTVEYNDGLDIGTNWLDTRYSDFPDWMWEDVDVGRCGCGKMWMWEDVDVDVDVEEGKKE